MPLPEEVQEANPIQPINQQQAQDAVVVYRQSGKVLAWVLGVPWAVVRPFAAFTVGGVVTVANLLRNVAGFAFALSGELANAVLRNGLGFVFAVLTEAVVQILHKSTYVVAAMSEALMWAWLGIGIVVGAIAEVIRILGMAVVPLLGLMLDAFNAVRQLTGLVIGFAAEMMEVALKTFSTAVGLLSGVLYVSFLSLRKLPGFVVGVIAEVANAARQVIGLVVASIAEGFTWLNRTLGAVSTSVLIETANGVRQVVGVATGAIYTVLATVWQGIGLASSLAVAVLDIARQLLGVILGVGLSALHFTWIAFGFVLGVVLEAAQAVRNYVLAPLIGVGTAVLGFMRQTLGLVLGVAIEVANIARKVVGVVVGVVIEGIAVALRAAVYAFAAVGGLAGLIVGGFKRAADAFNGIRGFFPSYSFSEPFKAVGKSDLVGGAYNPGKAFNNVFYSALFGQKDSYNPVEECTDAYKFIRSEADFGSTFTSIFDSETFYKFYNVADGFEGVTTSAAFKNHGNPWTVAKNVFHSSVFGMEGTYKPVEHFQSVSRSAVFGDHYTVGEYFKKVYNSDWFSAPYQFGARFNDVFRSRVFGKTYTPGETFPKIFYSKVFGEAGSFTPRQDFYDAYTTGNFMLSSAAIKEKQEKNERCWYHYTPGDTFKAVHYHPIFGARGSYEPLGATRAAWEGAGPASYTPFAVFNDIFMSDWFIKGFVPGSHFKSVVDFFAYDNFSYFKSVNRSKLFGLEPYYPNQVGKTYRSINYDPVFGEQPYLQQKKGRAAFKYLAGFESSAGVTPWITQATEDMNVIRTNTGKVIAVAGGIVGGVAMALASAVPQLLWGLYQGFKKSGVIGAVALMLYSLWLTISLPIRNIGRNLDMLEEGAGYKQPVYKRNFTKLEDIKLAGWCDRCCQDDEEERAENDGRAQEGRQHLRSHSESGMSDADIRAHMATGKVAPFIPVVNPNNDYPTQPSAPVVADGSAKSVLGMPVVNPNIDYSTSPSAPPAENGFAPSVTGIPVVIESVTGDPEHDLPPNYHEEDEDSQFRYGS